MCIDFELCPIHTAGEGVNSITIQCVHEQSLTGICIFPVFYLLPMDNLCTNRSLKQKTNKKYSELVIHGTLKKSSFSKYNIKTLYIKVLLQ